MTDNSVVVSVRRATTLDPLDHLIDGAHARALHARGGVALLEQLWGSETTIDQVRAAVAHCVRNGQIWLAHDGQRIVAGALVRERCVQAIWVEAGHRRQGVASAVLHTLLGGDGAPLDAWALPGDRATKSLYESVGWKARLLTMRGA